MSNIIKAREILNEVLKTRAVDPPARDMITEAISLMYKESKGRVPNQSVPMTAEIAKGIKAYKFNNPDASHQDIAHAFDVNPGRVSEALDGKW